MLIEKLLLSSKSLLAKELLVSGIGNPSTLWLQRVQIESNLANWSTRLMHREKYLSMGKPVLEITVGCTLYMHIY